MKLSKQVWDKVQEKNQSINQSPKLWTPWTFHKAWFYERVVRKKPLLIKKPKGMLETQHHVEKRFSGLMRVKLYFLALSQSSMFDSRDNVLTTSAHHPQNLNIPAVKHGEGIMLWQCFASAGTEKLVRSSEMYKADRGISQKTCSCNFSQRRSKYQPLYTNYWLMGWIHMQPTNTCFYA